MENLESYEPFFRINLGFLKDFGRNLTYPSLCPEFNLPIEYRGMIRVDSEDWIEIILLVPAGAIFMFFLIDIKT